MTEFDAELAAERRAAARLLLRHPLVTPAAHPHEFPLIRRHADWLVRQFHQVLGYRLVVEGRFARLHKAGPGPGAGRRLERAGGGAFTPRAYAYVALALSVLVTAPEQLLLSELVARTRAAAAEAGIDLGEPNRPAERRAMVAALRQLTEWRALREDEGSVDRYATADGESEALLGVDREIARRLVSGPLTRAADGAELIAEAAQAGPGGVRHRVRRLLVETPVVYLDELTAEERDWLRREQRDEQRLFEDFLGLDTEIRAEGAALIDPAGELTDLEFPGTGTVPHAALLLLERLLGRHSAGSEGPSAEGPMPIGVSVRRTAIEEILTELLAEHGAHWARAYVENPTLLFDAVTGLLARMNLLVPGPSEGIWTLRAAAARYRSGTEDPAKEPRT